MLSNVMHIVVLAMCYAISFFVSDDVRGRYHSGHFPELGLDGQSIAPSFNGTLLLPQLLSNNGYATAGIGKLAPLTDPTSSGFDFFIGQVDQGLCHNMYAFC